MKREEGYYWVRTKDKGQWDKSRWLVLQWDPGCGDAGEWYWGDIAHLDEYFEEIDERRLVRQA